MFMKISDIFKEWIKIYFVILIDIKITKNFHTYIYIFNTKKILVQHDFFFCNANLYNTMHIHVLTAL